MLAKVQEKKKKNNVRDRLPFVVVACCCFLIIGMKEDTLETILFGLYPFWMLAWLRFLPNFFVFISGSLDLLLKDLAMFLSLSPLTEKH